MEKENKNSKISLRIDGSLEKKLEKIREFNNLKNSKTEIITYAIERAYANLDADEHLKAIKELLIDTLAESKVQTELIKNEIGNDAFKLNELVDMNLRLIAMFKKSEEEKLLLSEQVDKANKSVEEIKKSVNLLINAIVNNK